jgi:hypothetical protein
MTSISVLLFTGGEHAFELIPYPHIPVHRGLQAQPSGGAKWYSGLSTSTRGHVGYREAGWTGHRQPTALYLK